MTVKSGTIVHVFWDTYMGWGHRALHEIMLNATGISTLKRGEVAVFVNRSMNGVKMLCPDNTMFYWRSPTGAPLTMEELVYLPSTLGAPKLGFKAGLEKQTIAGFTKRFTTKFGNLQGESA